MLKRLEAIPPFFNCYSGARESNNSNRSIACAALRALASPPSLICTKLCGFFSTLHQLQSCHVVTAFKMGTAAAQEHDGDTSDSKRVQRRQQRSADIGRDSRRVACGLASGAIQAGVFNPYDRALYLSVQHKRAFLSPANFANPYQGFAQSIVLRMVSSGLYFPLEEIFMPPAQRFVPDNQRLAHFLAGLAAGGVNAIVMNPATAVKYAMWDSNPKQSYSQSAVKMWRNGGARPFLKGITATLARDCTFGGVFASLRYKLAALYAAHRAGSAEQQQQHKEPKETAFVTDLIAAAVATTASSPFNYIRNIQYGAASTDRAPSGTAIVQQLLQEVG
jgi:Mitochondrial carrier protein